MKHSDSTMGQCEVLFVFFVATNIEQGQKMIHHVHIGKLKQLARIEKATLQDHSLCLSHILWGPNINI